MIFAQVELPNALAVVPDVSVDVADLANELAVAQLVGASRIAVMTAEHGTAVRHVADAGKQPSADTLVTQVPGLALAALAADCVPIAWSVGNTVAVTHAGWRGVLAGAHLVALDHLPHGDVHAVIGPSICGSCYEVSEALADEFDEVLPHAVVSPRHLDLAGAVELDLAERGVQVIRRSGCTLESDRLRSYRGGDTQARGGIVVVRHESA